MQPQKFKQQKKYKNLYNHTGRYNIILGGRGSGKTFAITYYLILLTFEPHQRILFTRLTMTSAYKSIVKEVSDVIGLLGLTQCFKIHKNEITNLQTGSSISFMGFRTNNGDNTARLKGLAGISTLVVDEAEELVDEEMFNTVNLSIRTKLTQNRVILILNPCSKVHWIYKRFFESRGVPEGFNGIVGDTNYVHSTYLDNLKYLSPSTIAEAEQMKVDNPDKYKHTMLGGWLDKSEGVIYKNWEYGEFPDNVDSIFGADFGFSLDPNTLIETYVDKVSKKIYLKEHLYQKELTTSELTTIYESKAKNKIIIADSAEPRLIDEVKKSGIKIIPCKKGDGSVKAGIKLIQDYKLIIDKESINLVKEINNYSWKVNAELPIDKYNHLLDAMRYAVTFTLNKSDGNLYIY